MNEEFSNLRRVWIHQTGMQITTLVVLAASFSIISFVVLFMLNLESVISGLGDSIRVTAYLNEGVSQDRIAAIKQNILSLKDTASLEYIDKASAKNLFKEQMATYAPSLFNDVQFSNPFPASFIVTLKTGLRDKGGVSRLQRLAGEIQAIADVEEVSYGQTWVQNFSRLAEAISRSGWILISVLLAGSLLIISNAIRASISSRKDEIEILELVGATARMIRTPFIFEAAVMGFLAMFLALVLNYTLFTWGNTFLKDNLSFVRISDQILFMRPLLLIVLIVCGPTWGMLSAYFTIQKINNGWAAAEGKAE